MREIHRIFRWLNFVRLFDCFRTRSCEICGIETYGTWELIYRGSHKNIRYFCTIKCFRTYVIKDFRALFEED